MSGRRRCLNVAAAALTAILAGTSGACRQDMHDQPKYEPLEASEFFADGRASRQPVAGTIARGGLREDPVLYRGLDPAGGFARTNPLPVTAQVLRRGQERYDIFCSPCHDRTGSGRGMIVRRGFKQPSSFHVERLRAERPGYFFDVMTSGFGQMSSYAGQVPVEDRWAIAAYIQALQLSQYAPATVLTGADRAALAAAPRAADTTPLAPHADDPLSPDAGTPSPSTGGTGETPHHPAGAPANGAQHR